MKNNKKKIPDMLLNLFSNSKGTEKNQLDALKEVQKSMVSQHGEKDVSQENIPLDSPQEEISQKQEENKGPQPPIKPIEKPDYLQLTKSLLEQGDQPAKNGKVQLVISKDYFTAFLNVIAPKGGGTFVTEAEIYALLEEKKISFGVQEEMIAKIVAEAREGEYIVAEGVRKTNGKDGKVKELFPRERKLNLIEKKDKNIDFKELNNIMHIDENQVICEISPPVEGESGTDIFGNEITPTPPKPAQIPMGKNTHVNEEGDALLASLGGNLVFKGNAFHVEDVYVVDGNVDISSGNISFHGSIVVKGDVYEGFYVHSHEGSVTVKGAVAGGDIFAKEDVILTNGINGGFKAKIICGGDIKSKFIQNCEVTCKGNIITETLIHSTVHCDQGVTVIKGRGLIVGGEYHVQNFVHCKQIGTKGNILTTIRLGGSQEIFLEKRNLERDLENLREEAKHIEKNISYVEQKLKGKPHVAKADEVLGGIKKQKIINIMLQKKILDRLESIHKKINDMTDTYIQADKVFSPAQFFMGTSQKLIQNEELSKVYVIKEEEQIQLSSR